MSQQPLKYSSNYNKNCQPTYPLEVVNKKALRSQFFNRISKNCLSTSDYIIIVGTLAILIGASVSFFLFQDEISAWYISYINTFLGKVLWVVSVLLLTLQLSFLAYLFILYKKYKPIESVHDSLLPTCTVIVPAYNEGRLVYETLLSLADSNFPSDKMEIICVDDGSKDDTWNWMLKAKKVLGNRLSIYQQPQNKGKRHALYHGFTTGKGDIFVTVDSDSIVEEDTLRNLVSPFVNNRSCGAVAGNVRVLNKEEGLIPKMLHVSFTFSFEFVRSAQSTINTVLCTPGALAAYKREAVLACLDEWVHQKFLGVPSAIGEDRAITNMILKQGYQVKFQKNALVYTSIPENYTTLYKMLLRWERSNIRENIMMSKFAFTHFRSENVWSARWLLIMQWVKVIFALPLFATLIFFVFAQPWVFLITSLTGIFVFSAIQMLFYARRYNTSEGFLAFTYSIFYLFALFWIPSYAIVTARKSGWLTRQLSGDK